MILFVFLLPAKLPSSVQHIMKNSHNTAVWCVWQCVQCGKHAKVVFTLFFLFYQHTLEGHYIYKATRRRVMYVGRFGMLYIRTYRITQKVTYNAAFSSACRQCPLSHNKHKRYMRLRQHCHHPADAATYTRAQHVCQAYTLMVRLLPQHMAA